LDLRLFSSSLQADPNVYFPEMSRLRRIEQQDRIFFVTSNVARGAPNLSPVERDLVLNSLNETRTAHRFLLFGYVVMPDHVHALFAVISSSLAEIMHRWKLSSSRSIQKARGKQGPLWQARYFDFICRRTRDVANKLDYIHENPVVARLVSKADEWRWSSAAFYSKTRPPVVVPDIMDLSGDPDELLWPAPWRRK
jgi:putative transposase